MDKLRQRRDAQPSLKRSIPRVQYMVKQLDLFPKVHDDYVIRTNEGGISKREFYEFIRSFNYNNGNYAVSSIIGALFLYDSSKA